MMSSPTTFPSLVVLSGNVLRTCTEYPYPPQECPFGACAAFRSLARATSLSAFTLLFFAYVWPSCDMNRICLGGGRWFPLRAPGREQGVFCSCESRGWLMLRRTG